MWPAWRDEISLLHDLFNLQEVGEYLWDGQAIPVEQTEEIIRINENLFEQHNYGLWLIRKQENKQLIGFAGLWYFFDEPQPQLLYALDGKFWGKGYATEVSRRVIQYAFEELGFSYLLAACDKPHTVSVRVMQRLGMQFLKEELAEGKETVWYKIDKRDFL